VGSESETWNMCSEALELAIKDRIQKGKNQRLLYVNLYEMPAKVKEILRVAEKYSIKLIEDAAEAFGSIYKRAKMWYFWRLFCFFI
jgi:dTDP-4-amino-4,6-dideoxygalactose transaminase